MPKLRKEAADPGNLSSMSTKKANVDVISDQNFRMCYFFRRMNQRHAVLLKEHLIFDPKTGKEIEFDEEAYAEEENLPTGTAEGPIRVKDEPVEDELDINFGIMPPQPPAAVLSTSPSAAAESAATESELPNAEPEEERDLKPEIRVRYNGFGIFGKMLIVVVEPSASSIQRNPRLFDSLDQMRGGTRQLSAIPTPGPQRRAREESRAAERRNATPVHQSRKRKASATSIDRGGDTPLFRGDTPSDAGGSTPLFRRSASVLSFGARTGSQAPSVAASQAAYTPAAVQRRNSRISGAPFSDLDRESTQDSVRAGSANPLREQSIALSDISFDEISERRRTSSQTPLRSASVASVADAAPQHASRAGTSLEGDGDEEEDEDWWREHMQAESEAFGLATQLLQTEEESTEGDARGGGEDE